MVKIVIYLFVLKPSKNDSIFFTFNKIRKKAININIFLRLITTYKKCEVLFLYFFKKICFFFFFFIFFNKPFVVLEFSSYHTLVLLFFVYTLSNIIFISSNWVDNVTVSCYLSLDNWYYMLINPSLSSSCFIPKMHMIIFICK